MPIIISIIADVVVAVSAGAAAAAAGLAVAVGVPAGTAAAIGGLVGNAVVGLAVTAAISEVASLFAPTPQFSTSPITFKADTNAGIPYVIGRCGVGGNIVFVDTSDDGHNTWLHYITVLSAGPVASIDSFTANNVPVTFDPVSYQANHLGYNWRGLYVEGTTYNPGDGVSYNGSIYICEQTATDYDPTNTVYWQGAGSYAGPAWLSNMWQVQQLGLQPEGALPAPPDTGDVPEWTSANGLSGLACTRWILKSNAQSYPTGTPQPLWVVKGMPCYDPRQDSTYPGGSGSQRLASPSTWAWTQNPFIQALQWVLGQTNNGIRTIGLGAPISRVDVAAFVNGANVADANGWTVGGVAFSTDSKWDVLTAILQAGCGAPMRNGALISCTVNAPRVSIATLTGDDCVGSVTVQATVARKDRINRVLYHYRSELQAWQMIQAEPIVVDAYVAADGQQRTKGIPMNYVTSLNQGAQLARYAIEDARELGPITLPLKSQWMGLQPGDAVTIDEEEYGLTNQLCLVMHRKVDPNAGSPTLTLRTETSAKHPFALGQTGTAPAMPALTGYNLVAAAPASPPWSATGANLTGSGVSIPAILITGTMENANASNLVIQIRLSAAGSSPAGAWAHYDSPPASAASRVELTSVAAGVQYDVMLSYLVRGVTGLPLVIWGVTAGSFAGSGASSNLTPTAVTWPNLTITGTGATSGVIAAQTISGITAPISLTLTYTGGASLAYVRNGGAPTPFASGATVTVSNGDTLGFVVTASATGSGTLTITNASSGGAAVGAPTYSATISGVVNSQTGTWSNISTTSSGMHAVGSAGTVTFSAINVPIALSFTLSGGGGGGQVSYSYNSGANVTLTSGATLSIAPGDTLAIVAALWSVGSDSGSITVNNTTAGTTMETITWSLTALGVGVGGGGGGEIP